MTTTNETTRVSRDRVQELIELLEDDDRALASAADCCGYLFAAETVEELEEELDIVRDTVLIGVYSDFESYADEVISDWLSEVPAKYEQILYYFDNRQFAYDLRIETNYEENYDGCFVFDI